MKRTLITHSHFLILLIFLFFLTTNITFAVTARYTPIVGIPGIEVGSTPTLIDFVNKIYLLSISVGAIFAVIKITIAGVKYSMSDVITSKEEAKNDIKGVLLGLAILLLPYLVLTQINPDLVNLDVLNRMQAIGTTNGSGTGGTVTNVIGSNGGTIITGGSAEGQTQITDCSAAGGGSACGTLARCQGAGGTRWIPADTNDSTAGGSCYR